MSSRIQYSTVAVLSAAVGSAAAAATGATGASLDDGTSFSFKFVRCLCDVSECTTADRPSQVAGGMLLLLAFVPPIYYLVHGVREVKRTMNAMHVRSLFVYPLRGGAG